MGINKEIEYKLVFRDECEMCKSKDVKLLGKRLNTAQGKKPKNKVGISVSIMECNKCGLIYPEPLPIPLNIQDHYGVNPDSYWNDDYFKFDKNYFKSEIETVKKLYQGEGQIKALDIGSGIGKCMTSLNKAGFDAYGLEPSETFRKLAIERGGITEDRLFLSPIEDFEFEENFFDFVTFGAVLEHLYHPETAIKKAFSFLKPGGLIHIEVPSSDWLIARLANRFYKFTRQDYVVNLSPMHSPYHLYEFSLDSFNKIANKLGFEVAHYDYFVCQTYAPKPFDRFLANYMKKTNKGMQLSIWLRKK